jgi:hypothetical protein
VQAKAGRNGEKKMTEAINSPHVANQAGIYK